jgi:CHAD domain-containing protein
VHFLRVTAKKLRALLRLIRPAIGGTAFERENARLRNAARSLAGRRESDVIANTLQALGATAALRRWRRRSKAGTLATRTFRSVIHTFERSRSWWQKQRLQGDDREVTGCGLSDTYRSSRRRMKAAGKNPDSESFHRWRIRVKHLYYQIQWLEPVRPRRFHAMAGDLHKLETLLGDDHDLAVLQQLLQSAPESFGDGPAVASLAKLAAARSRCLQRAAISCGECVFRESPNHFARETRRHLLEWNENG